MKPRDDADVAEWLRYADADDRAAKVLFESSPTFSHHVGFHCQQAVEKRLKAVLAALGQPVPKVHDLVALFASVAEVVPIVDSLRREAAWLTTFAVLGRYPSFLLADTDPEGSATRCLATCATLSAIVDAAFERRTPPPL